MALPTEWFDYPLPPELIAQHPAERRDASRLLVVDRARHRLTHAHFRDLPDLLLPSDRLFRNTAAVLPARLAAQRPTGGKVECFLLAEAGEPMVWRCLIRPARKLPPGATFAAPDGAFAGEVLSREEEGLARVRFTTPDGAAIAEVARRQGEIPLPPYIARADPRAEREADRSRYQTVYADPAKTVAVAAPTAGLHFTPELLARLAARGIESSDLVLHVGLGTFRPIATETVEQHPIHTELYEIPVSTQQALFAPAGRRVAVGTTAVRSIEDFRTRQSAPARTTFVAASSLYVYPPRTFQAVDALITNFHLPRSTLLCLVAAFLAPGSTAGIAWLREIYAQAVTEKYRFLSYGDAMLIV